MQQLLVDALTGDQVILAPARALRPDTFRVQPQPATSTSACPFCDGREAETPPELARIGSGEPDSPGWDVRVVPNKYPIVGDGVRGAHEVVIFAPRHEGDFAQIPTPAAVEVLSMLRDRAAFHLAAGLVYAQPFVNHGKAAGASIAHPHAQLVVLDAVAPRVRARLDRFAADPDLLARDQEHLVSEGPAPVWSPRAPTTAFAMRCAPDGGGARFDQASDDDIRAVATALHDTVARMRSLFGDLAYNLVFATAPRGHADPFRWWVDIVPRLGVPAGFELGTGIWVNIVAPADAAAALRGAQ
jgi:UDPglucose--hexose-1-phosphate uridylyltransferase